MSSEYDQSRRNETYEVDDRWLDAPGREAETDEDGRDTESDGYTEEPLAEPGTRPDVLWGFRPSDISYQATCNERYPSEAKALDGEAINKLWDAAGYWDGWLDVADREAETDEDGRDTESDGYTEEPSAEPGTRPDVL